MSFGPFLLLAVLEGTVMAAVLALTAGMASAEGKLSIYHWFEYIPQDLLDKFSKEYDVEVTMDTFEREYGLTPASATCSFFTLPELADTMASTIFWRTMRIARMASSLPAIG